VAELGEDLAQVVLDRVGADEQSGADLGIGQAVADQLCDLHFLSGQLLADPDGSLGVRLRAASTAHVTGVEMATADVVQHCRDSCVEGLLAADRRNGASPITPPHCTRRRAAALAASGID
jgi:hypothetical protein